jgi:hypothetical protein
VAFDLTLGDGWSNYAASEDGVLLAQHDFRPPGLVLFGAWQIDTLYADPCQHTPAPTVGDGVDALVAAFRATPTLHAGAPVATTVGGRPATQLDLAIPNDVDPATCVNDEYAMWGFHGVESRYVPPGYRDVVEKVWILEVDGTRVVLSGALSEGTDADVEALHAIIESIRFH